MPASRTLDFLGSPPLEKQASIGLRLALMVADGQHRRCFRRENLPKSPMCLLMDFSLLRCVPQPQPPVITDHTQIFTGEIFWEEITARDMKSKLDLGERPGRPACDKEHALVITELWRVFSRCWVKDPKGRISILDALKILQYLWVPMFFSQVVSANSL